MWKIVDLSGIPVKIIKIMRNIYEGSESCVRVSQGQTNFFVVDRGIRQGDSLSPLLFNIVSDYVMKKIEPVGNGIEWSNGRRLRDLTYADGICLLADELHDLRNMTEALGTEASKVELRINRGKNGSDEDKVRIQQPRCNRE